MSDQYLGEIRVFPFNFAPLDWAQCNGQLLAISQNTALFSLLGTQFGGNGTNNFALPNLQGSFPIDQGQGPGLSLYDMGETGGESAITLLISEIPSHTHAIQCAATANTTSPAGAVLAGAARGKPPAYAAGPGNASMSGNAVATAGSSQAHNNMPPYLTLNFCIALTGIYPSRS